ncbi:MAG: hypothetical protein ACQER7_09560, partial [Bacteroidota bacterium]
MSDKFQDKYRIPSARLPGYDYSRQGKYFITLCTGDQGCYFGNIENQTMFLSESGKIVQEQWMETPDIRPDMNLILDVFCVMPNHFHAIIEIGENEYNQSNAVISDYEIFIMYEIYKNVMNGSYGNAHCRDAMHGVSTPENIHEHCRVAMHRVSTLNGNGSTKNMATANDLNTPGCSDTNKKQNQQKDNTNSTDSITSYKYYNRFGPQRKNLASIMRGFKS